MDFDVADDEGSSQVLTAMIGSAMLWIHSRFAIFEVCASRRRGLLHFLADDDLVSNLQIAFDDLGEGVIVEAGH